MKAKLSAVRKGTMEGHIRGRASGYFLHSYEVPRNYQVIDADDEAGEYYFNDISAKGSGG
jgi:hypothetical protein